MQLNSVNHVLFRSAPFTQVIMCMLLLYVESSVLNVHSLVHNTEELYIPVYNIFFSKLNSICYVVVLADRYGMRFNYICIFQPINRIIFLICLYTEEYSPFLQTESERKLTKRFLSTVVYEIEILMVVDYSVYSL